MITLSIAFKKRLGFVLMLPAFLFAGCHSVVQSKSDPTPPAIGKDWTTDHQAEGMAYYLPKGKIVVAGAYNNTSKSWDITITPVIEPDPLLRLVARRNQNIFFDDDVTLTVDPKTGLLQMVNATTTDQTVAGLGSLISAAASALTFGAGLGPVAGAGAPADYKTLKLANFKDNAVFSSFQATLYPHQDTTASPPHVRDQLCYVVSPDANPVYAAFSLSCVPADPNDDPDKQVSDSPDSDYDGIVVRRTIPFTVSVNAKIFKSADTPVGEYSIPAQTILLPDQRHNYTAKIQRTALVSNKTVLTLQNGTISSRQEVRPSIFLGIVGVPQNLLKALAPIPLQVKTDQYNLISTEDKTLSSEADIKKLKGP